MKAPMTNREGSILASLRSLIPDRMVTSHAEALRIAEHQATRLLELFEIDDGPIPVELIAELPKIHVEYIKAPVSGACFWNGTTWVIQLNRHESWTRQRATLAHEYKHIVDHARADTLYAGSRTLTAHEQAERVADFFAGCLLVPKKLLKRAYYGGIQRTADLAEHFQVSEAAITVRLNQTGITEPTPRCLPPATLFSQTQPNATSQPQPQPQGV
ncbi:ImmA/IrrE family metallo-endopeptidase [Sinomonas albida]|uniref:ImmA/IrrE family metallo-endopeptidase n=1 Tax=Sinomonas albida TaxID=369942 RepID=UPI003017986E